MFDGAVAHRVAEEWKRRLTSVFAMVNHRAAGYLFPASEWLRFCSEPDDAFLLPREDATLRLETLAIWRALSCCDGYGGVENLAIRFRDAAAVAAMENSMAPTAVINDAHETQLVVSCMGRYAEYCAIMRGRVTELYPFDVWKKVYADFQARFSDARFQETF
ncbi:hypothetical protein Gpo141_00012260 [Globisporangium polare]